MSSYKLLLLGNPLFRESLNRLLVKSARRPSILRHNPQLALLELNPDSTHEA